MPKHLFRPYKFKWSLRFYVDNENQNRKYFWRFFYDVCLCDVFSALHRNIRYKRLKSDNLIEKYVFKFKALKVAIKMLFLLRLSVDLTPFFFVYMSMPTENDILHTFRITVSSSLARRPNGISLGIALLILLLPLLISLVDNNNAVHIHFHTSFIYATHAFTTAFTTEKPVNWILLTKMRFANLNMSTLNLKALHF